MLPGDSSDQKSSAESVSKATERIRPLIIHLKKARKISLPSSVAAAQPLAGKSRFNLLPPSQSNQENENEPLNNPLHEISSLSSAIAVANNGDLLTLILLCLPPKSLLRFQSVSREWLSIISNPTFRALHSRVYPTTAATTEALFLFRRIWKKSAELNFVSFSDEYVNPMGSIVSHLSSFFNYGEIADLHSCNWLLALVIKLNGNLREFVVFNPTTRQHRLIPQLNLLERGRYFVALNIVFDPLKSDRYKLVCVWWECEMITDEFGELLAMPPTDKYGFSVYSSETGIWRDSEDKLEKDYANLETYFGNGVLWNGDLHWVSDWKDTLCFDLDKERLNLTMPSLPVPLEQCWDFRYFGVSRGCLYVIEVNNPGATLFDVFELARDYSQWVLKYHIDLSPPTILYPFIVDEGSDPSSVMGFDFCITSFLEDEKEKKASLVISVLGKVILYDINNKTVTELAEVRPNIPDGDRWGDYFRWKDAYQHMETFANV